MNRIERAIILAAGKGTRMHPLTESTPKPLVSVNGTRFVDSIISALHKNGIFEIYIVVGYLKEQFYSLPTEYSGVTLIENPDYDSANNISSLYVAKEHLENSIIIEGDLLVANSAIFSPDFERSGYAATWTSQPTKEWLLTVNDGVVVSCSRTGGSNGWQLYGVSKWCAEDGRKLKKHVADQYIQNNNREIYWDDIPLFCYPQEYKLEIHPMDPSDVVEIDSLDDLIHHDQTYARYKE